MSTRHLGWDAFIGTTDSNVSGVVSLNGWYLSATSNLVPDFTGLVASGWTHIDSLAGAGTRSQKLRMTIWGDAGGASGPSTTLIGVTDEVIVNQATSLPAWIQFSAWTNFGGAPTLTPLTRYWVGLWYGTVAGSGQVNNNVDGSGTNPANAGGHSWFQTAVTYSTTANPSVASWSDTGGIQNDSLYFDYEGGTYTPVIVGQPRPTFGPF